MHLAMQINRYDMRIPIYIIWFMLFELYPPHSAIKHDPHPINTQYAIQIDRKRVPPPSKWNRLSIPD